MSKELRRKQAVSVGFRYYIYTIVGVTAMFLAAGPLLIAGYQGTSNQLMLMSGLNCLAWSALGVLCFRLRSVYISIRAASRSIGLQEVEGGLTRMITSFSRESARYHQAAYSLRVSRRDDRVEIGESLWGIAELTYSLLNVRAVELSLFDEEAQLSSKAILLGVPKSIETQAMLGAEQEGASMLSQQKESSKRVVSKSLTFAGSVFGELRVEFNDNHDISSNDRHVLELLAAQGGIMLVDARFTEEAFRLRRLSEETTRAKTGFLANLSHELRGPLGIILNGTELALDGLCGELTEQQRDILTMIKESGDHLLDLVNDVLDYAKVEAGKILVTPMDLPLKPMLEDLVAVVRTEAMAKDHKLLLEAVEDTLGMVCDKRHARQILINFLTNAIKYTQDGGEITVRAVRDSENYVKISVKDTGIGIPNEQRSKVFGAFERVEDKYAMAQVGTGLGMPLTRRLTEVNNGRIGFESELGEGSTFWVKFPVVDIPEHKVKEVRGENGQAVIQGKGEVILLVDDDAESRDILETYLTHHGFRVLQATSGLEVMKMLRAEKVDLAIIENDLPGLPGEEMVSTIRSTPLAGGMPIILLSAKAFVFDIERFLKLGVDRCLSKPVSLSELAVTTRRLIDEARALDEIGNEVGISSGD